MKFSFKSMIIVILVSCVVVTSILFIANYLVNKAKQEAEDTIIKQNIENYKKTFVETVILTNEEVIEQSKKCTDSGLIAKPVFYCSGFSECYDIEKIKCVPNEIIIDKQK